MPILLYQVSESGILKIYFLRCCLVPSYLRVESFGLANRTTLRYFCGMPFVAGVPRPEVLPQIPALNDLRKIMRTLFMAAVERANGCLSWNYSTHQATLSSQHLFCFYKIPKLEVLNNSFKIYTCALRIRSNYTTYSSGALSHFT